MLILSSFDPGKRCVRCTGRAVLRGAAERLESLVFIRTPKPGLREEITHDALEFGKGLDREGPPAEL